MEQSELANLTKRLRRIHTSILADVITRFRLAAIVMAASGVVLAACSSDVPVAPYETAPGTKQACHEIAASAPGTVMDAQRRDVVENRALAWGDPAIVLRCGVVEPAALKPTSRCDMVGDVGWFAEKGDRGYVFTTIGRDVNVSVSVPQDYEPPADALADLESTIAQHTAWEKPCV